MGTALLCAVAFLYSADTGVYAVAALLVTLAGVAWEGRRQSRPFRLYSIALTVFTVLSAIFVLAINAAVAGLLDFRFWRTSLALVSIHRWNEPAGMSDAATTRLFVTLVAGSLIFVLRRLVPGDRVTSITTRSGFLLSAFVFAFSAMQTGLVRSDAQHIVLALYPMMFFAGAVLFSFRSGTFSAVAAVVAVAGSALFGQPVAIFQPSSFRYRLAQIRHPLTECPRGFREFSEVCYPAGFDELLQSGIHFLQQHSESAIRLSFSRTNTSLESPPAATLQAVCCSRSSPEGHTCRSSTSPGTSAPQPQPVFPDGDLSIAIDEVPNFTGRPTFGSGSIVTTAQGRNWRRASSVCSRTMRGRNRSRCRRCR